MLRSITIAVLMITITGLVGCAEEDPAIQFMSAEESTLVHELAQVEVGYLEVDRLQFQVRELKLAPDSDSKDTKRCT